MKIEAGKYYKTRDGRKVGPMRELDREQTDYPWKDQYGDLHGDIPDQRYSDSGRQIGMPISHDLISEWQDEAPSPIRTVTRREIVPGSYGKVDVRLKYGSDNVVSVRLGTSVHGSELMNAEELREAAHILNQIAEFLEENGK